MPTDAQWKAWERRVETIARKAADLYRDVRASCGDDDDLTSRAAMLMMVTDEATGSFYTPRVAP